MKNFAMIDLMTSLATNLTNVFEAVTREGMAEGKLLTERHQWDIGGHGYLMLSGACSPIREVFEAMPEELKIHYGEDFAGVINNLYPHLWEVKGDCSGETSNVIDIKKGNEYAYLVHSATHRILREARRMNILFNHNL